MARRVPIAGTELDPTIEFVEVKLNRRTYRLAFDFGAIAKAEGQINALRVPGEDRVNLLQGLAAAFVNGMDARQTLGLFWGAISIAHPGLTIQEAARMIRLDTLPDIMAAITKAYNLSMPGANELNADPTTAASEGGENQSSKDASSGSDMKLMPESTLA